MGYLSAGFGFASPIQGSAGKKLALVYLFAIILICSSCIDFQEHEFIKKDLSGRLIKLEDITHGRFYIYVKENETGDTLRYALRLSKFLREHDVQVGDSISKIANSNLVWFYKKRNGKFFRTERLDY